MTSKPVAVVTSLLVVAVSLSPAAAAGAATTDETSAYSGSHVSFDTNGEAVVDYTVDGRTIVESVAVESKSSAEAEGDAGAGVSLSSITSLTGGTLTISSTAKTSATVVSDSGARLKAHDNSRGNLVVRADGESQLVTANVSADAEAEQASEQRVVVRSDDGAEGAFIVVGDGDVTVNERGNVTAQIGEDGRLVYRQYAEGRTESDAMQERLIANGTAAAEVHVQQSAAASGEAVVDVVNYSDDTTVQVEETTENRVRMTVERSESEGRVIITSVSNATFESPDSIEVTVDGEAATRADSYAAVRSAAAGGETSKFLVRQSASADAAADVVVGINHFSERQVTMESADGATPTGDGYDDTDGDGTDSPTSGLGPGLGVGAAVVAVAAVSAALLARSRR